MRIVMSCWRPRISTLPILCRKLQPGLISEAVHTTLPAVCKINQPACTQWRRSISQILRVENLLDSYHHGLCSYTNRFHFPLSSFWVGWSAPWLHGADAFLTKNLLSSPESNISSTTVLRSGKWWIQGVVRALSKNSWNKKFITKFTRWVLN